MSAGGDFVESPFRGIRDPCGHLPGELIGPLGLHKIPEANLPDGAEIVTLHAVDTAARRLVVSC